MHLSDATNRSKSCSSCTENCWQDAGQKKRFDSGSSHNTQGAKQSSGVARARPEQDSVVCKYARLYVKEIPNVTLLYSTENSTQYSVTA